MNRQNSTPIISSLVPETSDLALDRLLSHPDDVLNDVTLDIQEKRAILSSWASDAPSNPSRRCGNRREPNS